MNHTMQKLIRAGAVAGTGILAAGLAVGPASAANPFDGKTVTYVVATSPGGGYDFYGRLVAKYMQKYLPGSTFVVKNVPGAGHIIGTNYIYNAQPNGETIGTFNTGLIYAQVLGRRGVKFDLGKMTWIGKAASDPRVIMVASQTNLKTINDLKTAKNPVRFSSSGVGSSGYNDTMMLSKVLGWNMKMILGYRGNDSELAMRRGEIQAAVGSMSSAELFVKNGYGRILAQIGGKKETSAPMLGDVVQGKNAKAIVSLVGSQADLARFTAGPPDIPADRTKALRGAYKEAMNDKDLRAAAATSDRPIDPAYGNEVATKVREALDQPPQVVELVSKILNIKPPSIKVSTKIETISSDHKKITFKAGSKMIKSKISGSRTKIKVGGKSVSRKALKAGMSCKIDYKPGGKNEPITMDCM